jgi:hypothetical protein
LSVPSHRRTASEPVGQAGTVLKYSPSDMLATLHSIAETPGALALPDSLRYCRSKAEPGRPVCAVILKNPSVAPALAANATWGYGAWPKPELALTPSQLSLEEPFNFC